MTQRAPELPKGYFFRVKEGFNKDFRVSLRRELLGRWISLQVDFWCTDDPALIVSYMERLKSYLETKQRNKLYYGEYPPKKNVGGED